MQACKMQVTAHTGLNNAGPEHAAGHHKKDTTIHRAGAGVSTTANTTHTHKTQAHTRCHDQNRIARRKTKKNKKKCS